MSHLPGDVPSSSHPPSAAPPVSPEATCMRCGYSLRGLTMDKHCPECGTPIWGSVQPHQTSGLGIAAMVLGIVSIPSCILYGIPSMICGILAIVFARQAERQVERSQASVSSLGMIKAGRICGWVGVGLSLAFWGVLVFAVLASVL